MQLVKSSEENRTSIKERKANYESTDDKNILMRDGWKAILIFESIGLKKRPRYLVLNAARA
jgi:hypothetical protein